MIELANVHKSFGQTEVLKGITASVEKGEDYGEVDAVMIGADIYGGQAGRVRCPLRRSRDCGE